MIILVDGGEEQFVDAILSGLAFWFEWGTGTQTEIKTRTDTVTGGPEARIQATEQDNGDDFDLVAQITATGTRAITEVGVFTLVTAGTMMIYHTFSAVNVETNDAIEFTFNVEIT